MSSPRFSSGALFVFLSSLLQVATAPAQPPEPKPLAAPAGAATTAAAEEDAVEGGALVAFLNLDRSAVGTLLEAQLRSKKLVNWWPRGLTAQLLDEIEPSPQIDLPAAEPAGDRRLPDALLLFRTQMRGADRSARIVACDPALGLRLGAAEVKLSADAGKDVSQLTTAATALLRKMGEPLAELWAVPPLRSQDLTRKHNSLRHSLASDLEQALLDRKGAFALELEYPQALTVARKIAGASGPIERPLPRIALGQFRTQGEGDQLQASLTISLRHAESSRTAVEIPAAAPADLKPLLEKAAAEMAGLPAEDALQPHDGAASGQAIAQVINEYVKAGDDQAVLSLAEAGLLVNPIDARFRTYALSMLARLSRQHETNLMALVRVSPPPPILGPISDRMAEPMPAELHAETLRTLHTSHRGLTHCEIALAQENDAAPKGTSPALRSVSLLLDALADNVLRSDLPPSMSRIYLNLRRRRQELALRLTELAATRGNARGSYLPSHFMFSDLSAEERQKLALRMIVQWRHYPLPEIRITDYANAAVNGDDPPEQVGKFLAQLAALDDPIAQAVAKKIQAERAPDPDAQVTFTPLSIPWKDGAEEPAGVCEFYLSLGDKGDLFGAHRQLVLMKKDGKSKVIWESEKEGVSFRGPGARIVHRPPLACFDGQFAWVPIHPPGKPARLLVIDAENETVDEFTAADGLPTDLEATTSSATLMAAALAPGKALLAGSFGKAWIGIATIDKEKGKSLKLIHEARDQPVREDRFQWKTTTLTFEPLYLYRLSGKVDGREIQRVLVGRNAQALEPRNHPLIVDPESGAVDVVQEPMRLPPAAWFVEHGGALYWTISSERNKTWSVTLWRRALPDLKSESLANLALTGHGHPVAFAFEGDRLNIAAQQWHVVESLTAAPRALRGKLPVSGTEPRQIYYSHVHGWLLYASQKSRLYAVEFKENP